MCERHVEKARSVLNALHVGVAALLFLRFISDRVQQTHPSGVSSCLLHVTAPADFSGSTIKASAAHGVRAPACSVVGPHDGAPSGLLHHAREEVRP